MSRKAKTKHSGMSIAQECELYERILPKRINEPGASPCLVIDAMSFAHTSYHAYNRLSHKGKSVSMIFGMPQIIRRYIMQENPAKVVVCWDGKVSDRRLGWLPEYKQHRKKNRDKRQRRLFEKEISRVRLLLYYMGIPQVWNERVEGDDMIYLVAKKESYSRPVIILSGDKDMLQLVNWDIRVVNIRNDRRHCAENFSLSEPYIRIDQIVDYFSLVGDDSDDIPGVRGIGPSKANGFLRIHNTWKEYFKDEDAAFPGLIDKDKHALTMKRNRKMMDIIWYCNKFHTKPKWITYYKEKSMPSFNEEKYQDFCRKWNLKTMLYPNFIKPFKDL